MKRIGHNIFRDENKIYSFLTHVATIDGDKLIEHGKYSRTTSSMFNLTIVENKTKIEDFDLLPMGIKI